MQETWKPVSGYENFYEISNTGNVKSIGRYIVLKNGKTRYVSERILRPKSTGGYLFVALSKEGVRKDYYLHRLVAEMFLYKSPFRNYVNHKDGNPSNNVVSNLEWVTHSENVQHAYNKGLYRVKGGNMRKVDRKKRRKILDFLN